MSLIDLFLHFMTFNDLISKSSTLHTWICISEIPLLFHYQYKHLLVNYYSLILNMNNTGTNLIHTYTWYNPF